MKVVSGKTLFGTLRRWLIDNELEIWRREQPITAIPMLLLIVILIFFFWIALPLMLLGLFFGFRYQVTGPDLEDDALNGVMGSVAAHFNVRQYGPVQDFSPELMAEVRQMVHTQYDQLAKQYIAQGQPPR